MTRVLIVEDEDNYREPLAFNLRRDGFDVLEAADGTSACALFARHHGSSQPIDVVLLDLMLPRMSGTDVCRRIRSMSDVPVIMVTARDGELEKILGLEMGADDYVTKPYSYRELVARVHAVLRRSQPHSQADTVLSVGRIHMDTAKHEVTVAGELVTMPLREFELLEMFLRHPDQVLSRTQIFERIWGGGYIGDTKTLDVHIKRLRSKVEENPSTPTLITTVRGLGYKLVTPA